MIQIPGSAEELNALRSEHFHHPHPRVQMKMAAVQLTALGADRSLVAAMLGFTETPVRTYLKAYRDGGIDALKPFEVGGSTSALAAHSDTLCAEFEPHPVRTVKEAQHRLIKLTGLGRGMTISSPGSVTAPVQYSPTSSDWGSHTAKWPRFPRKRSPRSRNNFSPRN